MRTLAETTLSLRFPAQGTARVIALIPAPQPVPITL